MIRKTIILLVIAAMPVAALAQGGLINFGVKGGITTQNVSLNKSYTTSEYVLNTKSNVGFHLGMIGRINLPLLHLQPELLFTHTSYKLKAYPEGTVYNSSSQAVRINTVEMPLLVGIRVAMIRFQAGPMFTLMNETNLKKSGYVNEIELNKPTTSYILGVGLDLGHLNFDVRWNGQFKKSTQAMIVDGLEHSLDYKSRFRNCMISVGYVF